MSTRRVTAAFGNNTPGFRKWTSLTPYHTASYFYHANCVLFFTKRLTFQSLFQKWRNQYIGHVCTYMNAILKYSHHIQEYWPFLKLKKLWHFVPVVVCSCLSRGKCVISLVTLHGLTLVLRYIWIDFPCCTLDVTSAELSISIWWNNICLITSITA